MRMNDKINVLAALLMTAISTYGAFVPNVTAMLPGAWMQQEAFSDEFESTVPDTNKWNTVVGSWAKWSWKPSCVSMSNGMLSLSLIYDKHDRAGAHINYSSGILMSKAPIRYGFFEARIKGSRPNPGTCPAFWVWKKTPDAWTEIDFHESGQTKDPTLVTSYVHVFRHPKLPFLKGTVEGHLSCNISDNWQARWDPSDDFHTYGCLWTPQIITIYVDGHPVGSISNTLWHQPLDLTLSLGLRPPYIENPSAKEFPAEMLVDYVRVWQKGDHESSPPISSVAVPPVSGGIVRDGSFELQPSTLLWKNVKSRLEPSNTDVRDGRLALRVDRRQYRGAGPQQDIDATLLKNGERFTFSGWFKFDTAIQELAALLSVETEETQWIVLAMQSNVQANKWVHLASTNHIRWNGNAKRITMLFRTLDSNEKATLSPYTADAVEFRPSSRD